MPRFRLRVPLRVSSLGLLLLAACGSAQTAAVPGAVGERVPASLFCRGPVEGWDGVPKLVVLLPARSAYDGMLRLAFQQYFAFGKALPTVAHTPGIRTVFVTGASQDPTFRSVDGDCAPAMDASALTAIAQATGRTLPLADDADATVLLLGETHQLQVKTTDLRETDVVRLQLAMPVEVTFDALPNRIFGGKITRIAPVSTAEKGSTNYTIQVTVSDLDANLRWGMTAFVNIQAPSATK